MKKTLLIISLLTIILISGAAKNNQTDSIAPTKQTVQLKELNAKVDSLLKITNELSKERNYFSTALGSQTMIFSIIITITLFLFGLISFASFKIEMKKHKTEIKLIISKQNEKIKTIEEKNKIHDAAINKALANTYATVAVLFRNTSKSTYFKYCTSAALYQMYNEVYDISTNLLKSSLETIEDLDYYQNTHKDVVEKYTSIDKDFLELINCKDEAVRKIALKIYSKYLEFKEQKPVVEASPEA